MSSDDFVTRMEKALKNAPENRHSFFQLKYFVVGKEPTTQSKMWRCLRELQSRKEALDALDMEIEDSKDRLLLEDIAVEKLELCLPPKDSPIYEVSKREVDIKRRRRQRKKASTVATLERLEEKRRDLHQEARFFLEAYESLEKEEDIKMFDDIRSQEEYWNAILGNKLNLKILLQQPIDIELAETILALPDSSPVKRQALLTLDAVKKQMSLIRTQLAHKEGNGPTNKQP